MSEHEARWYQKLDGERVQCHLCAHACVIAAGRRGVCAVRENRAGTLFSLVYGRVLAQHVDPIEKKPLFHYYPGSTAYSIATAGCNFRCLFCQNAEISQSPREQHVLYGDAVAPAQIARAAQRAGCRSIAYTYTEPTVFSEYALDVAALARAAGLGNVYVTNGYMTPALLDDLAPRLDAANVDLKAFRDAFYQQMCGARLEPVLESLRQLKRRGVWLEVTTLLIPDANDDPGELRELAAFIAGELGVETPWHISRFHPTYRLTDRRPTPAATLDLASRIGREAGLRYVYVGNAPGQGETTGCHHCGAALIERYGFQILANHIVAGDVCPRCGTAVAGRGMAGAA